MNVLAYLCASAIDQDASLSRARLDAFADGHSFSISRYYIEEAGAKLTRPVLFRLLSEVGTGDVLLIEQVDRLCRLTAVDWDKLKATLSARQVRVVALDLPTSWMMASSRTDELTSRMFEAINSMMLDTLAAVGRKDYEDRLRRQGEGQAKARSEGRLRGRSENTGRNAVIADMLRKGTSWSSIQDAIGCSRGTVAKVAARLRAEG